MTTLCFAIILLHHAPAKVASVLVLFVIFGGSCYVSQFTVETYCFADGRCLFKQPQSVIYHWNQYDEEISKKCSSARPSVRL